MPKSKRNKTVDLSKTKKHGLEGKKELYRKIQSNVENYANIFVFAVNDMRNSKMKNVREQWRHSRFCIGKNRVMALALGRTPEEEYRPNLHKIGQMLVGERGLLFTNQSVEEVTKWFESYSEADYARSGNIATQDVILPEGPLAQFPHNLESYLRQLGLPTTLKKGVIHLIKEHVVCREGDRLSPETARILKLLGYEMAEFRIKIVGFWTQNGTFFSKDPQEEMEALEVEKLQMLNGKKSFTDVEMIPSDSDGESELVESSSKKGKKSFTENGDDESVEVIPCDAEEITELVKSSSKKGKKSFTENGDAEYVEVIPCDAEEVTELVKSKSKKGKKSFTDVEMIRSDSDGESELVESSSKKGKKSFIEAEENSEDANSIEIISYDFDDEQEPKQVRQNSVKDKEKPTDVNEISEDIENAEEKVEDKSENDVNSSSPTTHLETKDEEMEVEEPEVKKPKNDSTVKKSGRKPRKTVNKQVAEETKEHTNGETINSAAILKLTEKKLEESAEKPKKFSPKMTRARAAAANKKIKTPEPLETKRSSRKRKM